MTKTLTTTLALGLVAAQALAGASSGETGFAANCASCHHAGGNSINPAKNLRRLTLVANGIRSAPDIVQVMRHPGPGMPRFDRQSLPDGDAMAIAEYILKSFD